MSKIGVNFSIDVTKLDKSKFYKGKNGSIYANCTATSIVRKISTTTTVVFNNH